MFRFSPNPNRAHLIKWREWGSDAFEEARQQNKLVMLFLGAFWCGICQRMDETTLSVDETITLVNAYFIPVRVEDAQRPDLNVRYNQSGWPTIVFMTPRGDHVASVNYMSPNDFCDVLASLYQTYTEGKVDSPPPAEVNEQASQTEPASSPVIPRVETVAEITDTLMELADPIYGGFGPDHKFLHPEALGFLLSRFHVTGDAAYLQHVALTLEKMRRSRTHDDEDGGFHRYSSKRDWTEPHQEKLLADHAGLLGVYLHMLVITGEPRYEGMAREIVKFIDTRLSDSQGVAFLGCQDYVRAVTRRVTEVQVGTHREPGSTFWIIDDWVYTDANAQAASAYLNAYRILGEIGFRDRALNVLDFLWENGRDTEGRLCHYYDGEPHVPGLLIDKARLVSAMLDAYAITEDAPYLERAAALGQSILGRHKNPEGGFHDISETGPAHLRYRLTLLTENGLAASALLRLFDITNDTAYGQGAAWALGAFTDDLKPYGVFASDFGMALAGYGSEPLTVTLEAAPGDPQARSLELAALDRLANRRVNWNFRMTGEKTAAALYLGVGSSRVGPVHQPAALTSELLSVANPS